jgi:cell division protein FtsZ
MPTITVGTAAPARGAVAVAPQTSVQQPVRQPASPARMAATAQAAAIQPQPAPAMAAPAMAAPAMTAPAIPPVQQPRLAGLDPRERIASSRTEEAQLDIPAFLRRQAN